MRDGVGWRDIIGQVVGGVGAVSVVIAASCIWRLPQEHSPQMVLVAYIASGILLFLGAFIIFRSIVRRGYEQRHRLTALPSFLQFLVWGLFFAFPCIYNPINWAWSHSYTSQAIPIIGYIAWACIWIGLIIMLGALGWLGLSRSLGQNVEKIVSSGPYRVTRNPQVLGGALLIVGYIVLWPSWYSLGWFALFTSMAHMMILTEEEHLRHLYSEDYEEYCKQVPRYLRFLQKP